MKIRITKVPNTNPDFLHFCKLQNDHHNTVVAEQRMKNADTTKGLEAYPNVLLAYVAGKPAGCVAFTNVTDNDYVEIARVFTDTQFRNLGLCTRLFEGAQKFARDNNAKRLVLDTYERCTEAVSLYKKLGFEIVKKHSWSDDDSPYSIYMQKPLDKKLTK